MSLPVLIRSGEAADAAGLTHLARAAKATWDYPAAWLQEWAPQLSFTAAYIADHPVLVAEYEDVLVGVVALTETPEPGVDHLWVAPRFLRRGIGRLLMEQAVSLARVRGWPALRIEADPNAVSFYENLGAVVVGEVAAPVAGTPRVLPVLRLPIATAD